MVVAGEKKAEVIADINHWFTSRSGRFVAMTVGLCILTILLLFRRKVVILFVSCLIHSGDSLLGIE